MEIKINQVWIKGFRIVGIKECFPNKDMYDCEIQDDRGVKTPWYRELLSGDEIRSMNNISRAEFVDLDHEKYFDNPANASNAAPIKKLSIDTIKTAKRPTKYSKQNLDEIQTELFNSGHTLKEFCSLKGLNYTRMSRHGLKSKEESMKLILKQSGI